VLVWQAGRGSSGDFLSGIAVFAALNGVLAQIVMAARVLFGLGKRSPALALFHHVHPAMGTPVLATCLIGAAVIVAALTVQLVTLAGITSSILLAVFVLVNLALILQKRRAPEAPFRVPMAVPWVGFVLSLAALILALRGAL
jgi:basic amino acid/polyamine antiporter, APA family